MGSLLRRLLNLEDKMDSVLKMTKLFLVFVAICATTTATPIPTTNANGASQIDQSIPRILVVTGYGDGGSTKKTELWPKPESQCALADFPLEVVGAVGFWTAQGPVVCGGYGVSKCFLYKKNQW